MDQTKFALTIAAFLAAVVGLSLLVNWSLMWYLVFFVVAVLVLFSIVIVFAMGGVGQGYELEGYDQGGSTPSHAG